MEISLCMIVKDEGAVLHRCLAAAAPAVDEIIIVDTGSKDNTKEIAASYGAKIYDFEWCDDFSAARNFSFAQATKDYILWLDADDVLPVVSGEALKLWKQTEPFADVVMMPYQAAFAEDGSCTLFYYRERLLKQSDGFQWVGAVHEVIAPAGEIVYLYAPVEHRPEPGKKSDRNLCIYRSLAKNGCLSPRDRYYYARELSDHGFFDESAEILTAFIEDSDGWIQDRKAACLLLSEVYRSIGAEDQRFAALLRYLTFSPPEPGLCCAMGRYYLDRGILFTAVFWFETALRCELPRDGFVQVEEGEFFPSLWLCLCYDRLGDKKKALFWHERAKSLRPEHPSVLYNTEYFRSLSGAIPE